MRLAPLIIIAGLGGGLAFASALQEEPKASANLTNLTGTIVASDWKIKEPGDGTIKAEGTYSAEVNTPTKDITEKLEYFLVLTIHYTDGDKVTGEGFATAKTFEKPGLAGTADPSQPFKETLQFALEGDDGADLDLAVTNLWAVLDKKAKNPGAPFDDREILTKIEHAMSVRVLIEMKGSLRGKDAADAIADHGTLSFSQKGSEKGNSIHPVKLNKLD